MPTKTMRQSRVPGPPRAWGMEAGGTPQRLPAKSQEQESCSDQAGVHAGTGKPTKAPSKQTSGHDEVQTGSPGHDVLC